LDLGDGIRRRVRYGALQRLLRAEVLPLAKPLEALLAEIRIRRIEIAIEADLAVVDLVQIASRLNHQLALQLLVLSLRSPSLDEIGLVLLGPLPPLIPVRRDR